MDLIADFHTHTIYSHGKGSIMDNVQAARKKGLRCIAITDHGPRHIRIGLSLKALVHMRREIDEINAMYKDIKVLMGVEANLISKDGTIDIPQGFLSMFDIILMGFHKEVLPMSLKQGIYFFLPNITSSAFGNFSDELIDINTKAYINAMDRYPISIITHPGAYIAIDTKRLAAAAAERGVYLEINSGHGYMTAEYVRIGLAQGARFVINSDAHNPEDVGNFEQGLAIAQQAGLMVDHVINAFK